MTDYRKLTKKELDVQIEELRSKVAELSFDIHSGDLQAVNEYRGQKRELAKTLTIAREIELGIKRESKRIVAKVKKTVVKPKKSSAIKKNSTKSKKQK